MGRERPSQFDSGGLSVGGGGRGWVGPDLGSPGVCGWVVSGCFGARLFRGTGYSAFRVRGFHGVATVGVRVALAIGADRTHVHPRVCCSVPVGGFALELGVGVLMALTFQEFAKINRDRCMRWHPGFPGQDGWTGADWANAMQGEAGEAGNIVKKLRRLETGLLSQGNGGETHEELKSQLAAELGDVVAYLDLLAQFYGLSLGQCVADKFNKVSIREDMPQRVWEDTVQ